jgi:hypothetical protein
MAERLTESLIKTLKAPPRGERFLWDAELTGFAIKIFAPTKAHPQGARTFVLSYWLNGSERRLRIGAWPDWSVAAARAEAREIRQRVDRGEDPARDRRERRQAPTMTDLAERYRHEIVIGVYLCAVRDAGPSGAPVRRGSFGGAGAAAAPSGAQGCCCSLLLPRRRNLRSGA